MVESLVLSENLFQTYKLEDEAVSHTSKRVTFYRPLGMKNSVSRCNSRERNHVLSETYQPSTVKRLTIYNVLMIYEINPYMNSGNERKMKKRSSQ